MNIQMIQERLDQLKQLEDGWNGYGAPPIAESACEATLELVTLLNANVPDLPQPRVHPTTAGGIELEWDTNGIELEFYPSRNAWEVLYEIPRDFFLTDFTGVIRALQRFHEDR